MVRATLPMPRRQRVVLVVLEQVMVTVPLILPASGFSVNIKASQCQVERLLCQGGSNYSMSNEHTLLLDHVRMHPSRCKSVTNL